MALRQKLETEIEAALFARAKEMADKNGLEISAMVEEAIAEWVARQVNQGVNPKVLELHEASIQQYRQVYEHLAK